MKKERRSFDKEFKKMAVDLVELGKSTTDVATDLGIGSDLIRRWKRELKSNKEGCFSGNGNANLSPEQKEIVQLKKELKDVQLEREILKKAVCIFSKDGGRYTSL